jgi:hypothetical protein
MQKNQKLSFQATNHCHLSSVIYVSCQLTPDWPQSTELKVNWKNLKRFIQLLSELVNDEEFAHICLASLPFISGRSFSHSSLIRA